MDLINETINDYTITKQLYNTINSTTYLASCSHGKVCFKVLKDTVNPANIENECKLLEQINHPHIIRSIDIFDWEGHKIITMPFAEGGDLFELIDKHSPIDEATAAQIMYSAFSAIDHLHSMGISHRDIKPENFLLMDDNLQYIKLVLCDLGYAKQYSPGEKESTEFLGTKYYMAPELLQEIPYDQSVDIWALGITMYMVLSGEAPFPLFPDDKPMPKETRDAILNADYDFNSYSFEYVSEEAKDLIQHLICVNPEERLTAKQALRHPWFRKFYEPDLKREVKEETKFDRAYDEADAVLGGETEDPMS